MTHDHNANELLDFIIPPYAKNGKLCNFIGQKKRYRIGQFALSSLWVLSKTPKANSTDSGAQYKVNCHPWLAAHFALGNQQYTVEFFIIKIHNYMIKSIHGNTHNQCY